jgi:hypothetical protein
VAFTVPHELNVLALDNQRSHTTFRTRSCRHLRRCPRPPCTLSNSPLLSQLSTGYQTAIQIP